jgi:hypothetical protein
VQGGVVGLAITVAHELGHSMGLEHTDAPADLMYSVAQPMITLPDWFHLSFAQGNYSSYRAGESPAPSQCGRPDPQDNAAVLTAALGARTRADALPPDVTWTSPPATATDPEPVSASFDVEVDAQDASGIARVEVYRNFDLIAALTAPPYRATLTATSDPFYVTVDAIDGALNRRAISRAFVLEPPPAVQDLGAEDAQPMMEPPPPHSGGCSFAP